MSLFLAAIALGFLLTILLGLAHVIRQPGGADSLLAALLFGSTGVGLMLVMGEALNLPRALDVALVFALLAAILGVAFTLRGWPEDPPSEDSPP